MKEDQDLNDLPNLATDKERYELIWPGKNQAKQAGVKPTMATLTLDSSLSVNKMTTENMYIEGDNLDALKLLLEKYRQSIKVIYIDPPYNTGQAFIFNDKFRLAEGRYKQKKVKDIKPDLQGRKHAEWLNFMYPRLVLAKQLLKKDGVIFISIDNREYANLKLMMDELFGEENFVGNIVRATGTTTGQDSGGLGSSFDYVLVYGNSAQFEVGGIPLSKKDMDRFKYKDEKGRYSILQLRKTGNEDKREDRPSMYYSVEGPDGSKVYPIGPGGYESRWRFRKENYVELEKDGFIHWKKDKKKGWVPYVKYYLEGRLKRPSSLWNDIDGNKKATMEVKALLGGKIFDFPKPVQLIKRCIQISNAGENDIILDFFSGSGTTAQAVMELNLEERVDRKFIMVQLPEKLCEDSTAYKKGYKTICDIGRKRIENAGRKIEEKQDNTSPLDTGFKVFKVTRS